MADPAEKHELDELVERRRITDRELPPGLGLPPTMDDALAGLA